MKKALVILLILAVAGGVFAQGLTFTGLVRGGTALSFTDETDSKPQLGLWSAKNGYGYRLDLNGAYTNEAANAGLKFNIRLTDAALSSDYAFAWLKVFDMVTFNAGDVSAGSYGTGGGIDTSFDTGAGNGLFVQIAPITGLEFGLGAYAASLTTISDVRYNFGVTYTAENLVTVVGNFRQGGTGGVKGSVMVDGKAVSAPSSPWDDMDAAIGVKVLALNNMGFTALNLDAAFLNLLGKPYRFAAESKADAGDQLDKDFMTIQIGQQIGWTDANKLLAVGGRFIQQFQTGTDASKFPDLSFAVYGSYDLGGIVPRLDVGFNKGTNKLGAIRNGMWDVIAKGDYRAGFDEKGMNLGIAPSVQFRLDGTTKFIELGYIFQKNLTDGLTVSATTPGMRNTVYVDFNVAW